MNRIYENLSSVNFLAKSYTFKFLFIAFLGIHIPLIGLILFILFNPASLNTFNVLLLTLLLTLAATGITLIILNGLLMPLRRGKEALQAYITKRELPSLPTHYVDEAGILMSNIQITINDFNDLLEEKKDMSSLLSHDLRTPMRNVKTFARLLKNEESEGVQEIAEMIDESMNEQSRLLENVLEIIKQDDLFFNDNAFEDVPVFQLLDENIASFENAAAAKGIALYIKLEYEGTVKVQPELFLQVLKNLTSNALKFSNPGSAVNFRVYKTGLRIHIEVSDSGLGFEPEIAERLFDRFTKKGRTGTAGEPSTGIGLYLSRKIIRHHRGDLTATSAGANQGSVFAIVL